MSEEGETENAVAGKELLQFIERIERLEEEKQTIQNDIKDVFGESKGRGYDTTAMREILKRRKKSKDELLEQDAILETYMQALGMTGADADA